MGEEEEAEKSIKVRALGTSGKWVGYFGLVRRRGGDVFTISPYTVKRNGKDIHITAESQFSHKWMERVAENATDTKPAHWSAFGGGQIRRNTPESTPSGTTQSPSAPVETPAPAASEDMI